MKLFSPCRYLRRPLLVASLASSLAAAPLIAATGPPGLVKAMLDNAPTAAENRCSYTRIRVKDDETTRERYRAGEEGDPWQLLTVNGRAPTPAELREYAADERGRRHPLAFDLRSMVSPDHWRLRSETGTEAVFEFRLRPNEDLDERLVDKVIGTLAVDKVRRQPVRINIENTEPAYVAPLVRVADYTQNMDFRWNPSVGASVLTRTETRYRGRALGFKVIRKHKLVEYTDYTCRPEMADAAE